jgi:hypothetical protein
MQQGPTTVEVLCTQPSRQLPCSPLTCFTDTKNAHHHHIERHYTLPSCYETQSTNHTSAAVNVCVNWVHNMCRTSHTRVEGSIFTVAYKHSTTGPTNLSLGHQQICLSRPSCQTQRPGLPPKSTPAKKQATRATCSATKRRVPGATARRCWRV